MPTLRCQKDGKPGYKYGESGTCYTYTPNNRASEAQALARVALQRRAIQAQQERSRK